MTHILILTLTSAVSMLIFDFIWLTTSVNRLYRPHIGHLMADNANFIAAGLFYILYVAALTVFITIPCYEQQSSLTRVALLGAFFGLAAYGTFDLTNQAILKDWPSMITIIDMAWGAILTGTVSWLSVYVARSFGN